MYVQIVPFPHLNRYDIVFANLISLSMAPFNFSRIQDDLSTHIIGSKVISFDEIDSTNELIKKHLDQKEGLTLLAETQTQGRGRLGRSWHSPKGLGIYVSVLLKPLLAPERLNSVTLMAGIAVVDAISPLCKRNRPVLKWPNDILINKRKLAGILCEYCPGENEQTGALIIGIGINVNHQAFDFPESLEQVATSLQIENGLKQDREPIIRSLLEHLDSEYRSFLNKGGPLLVEKWSSRTDLFGKEISLYCQRKIYRGTATHLSPDGKLAIRTQQGETLFFDSGEITTVR